MTERSDNQNARENAADRPTNGWFHQRVAIGLTPLVAALVLTLMGAEIAAAILMIVGLVLAGPYLVVPLLVLAKRARQRSLASGVSQ